MNLPNLVTVQPKQTALISRLANMMGESFLEELWTVELLGALECSEARTLEISQAIMHAEFTAGAPYQCCYALEDESACAGAYLKSDLQGLTWSEIENKAWEYIKRSVFTPAEATRYAAQSARMEVISDFGWEESAAQDSDFIHFYALGVDSRKRGSGAFRRLIEPFLAYADTHRIPCFLETYSDTLEALYARFGFETIEVLSDPAFDIAERCMMRTPQRA